MRSFTLIELIITIFIASIIILIFSMLLDFSYKTYEYVENSNSYEDMGFVLSYLTNEINMSQEVYSSDLVKIKPEYHKSNSIVIRQDAEKNTFKYIYFAIKDNTLYRLSQTSEEKDINSGKIQFDNLYGAGVNIIADEINDFTITYDTDTNIVYLYIQGKDGNSCNTKVFAYGGAL